MGTASILNGDFQCIVSSVCDEPQTTIMLFRCSVFNNIIIMFAVWLHFLKYFVSADTNTDTYLSSDRNSGRDAIFITVSSIKDSNIELNWKFTSDDPPTEIHLFTSDPLKDTNPVLTLDISNRREGYYLTTVSFTNYTLPGNWQRNLYLVQLPSKGAQCLNYWIAAYRNNQMTHRNCFRIQPTWMKDIGNRIGNVALSKLFVPGTHNSGCYDDNPAADIKIQSLDKYVYNQDQDVWTQMVFGIRYLDIRIGYYNTSLSPDSFWINHDIIKLNSLVDYLRQVKLFLDRAQDEVIILDIHRLPVGFKNIRRHRQLENVLRTEIGDIAIPRSFQHSPSGPTLNDIWRQKRRLIVSYAEKNIAAHSMFLWDPLNQKWGDQQTISGLKKYIQESNANHRAKNNNPLWAMMAELTPSTTSVLFGFLSSKKSLAHMADAVNRNLTNWYRDDWCKIANIVATDFFLGNDIINVAIDCNLNKT